MKEAIVLVKHGESYTKEIGKSYLTRFLNPHPEIVAKGYGSGKTSTPIQVEPILYYTR